MTDAATQGSSGNHCAKSLSAEDGPTLTWLGTAGFRVEHSGRVTLVDPFLTRNVRATPVQELTPADMSDADYIFVSHGHQDHLRDVPAILEAASGARVFCSEVSARTLARRGVPRRRIVVLGGGEALELDGLHVQVSACTHSTVDLKLMVSTAPRLLKIIPKLIVEEFTTPAGPLLAFLFRFGQVSVLHLGSMCGPDEVECFVEPGRTDIFLAPLRGRSDICELAASVTAVVHPRAVIPQHHDNFMPPLSPPVDLGSFRRLVKEQLPGCVYYEAVMNAAFSAADVLDII